MKLKELLSVVPRHEYFELMTRDKLIGEFRKIDAAKYVEHLDDVVFMVSADSSVLQIVLI